MDATVSHLPGFKNPFSAERLRPGAVSFLFTADDSVEKLIEQLGRQQWQGQIIGPHGTGKSTLIEHLREPIEHHRPVRLLRLTQEQPRPGKIVLPPGGVLIVDGFEQLKRWQRYWLRLRCRLRDCGLLVSAHADMGLPTLYHSQVSLDMACRVVQRLNHGWPELPAETIKKAYQQHAPNLRDMLFALYDEFERQFKNRSADG